MPQLKDRIRGARRCVFEQYNRRAVKGEDEARTQELTLLAFGKYTAKCRDNNEQGQSSAKTTERPIRQNSDANVV